MMMVLFLITGVYLALITLMFLLQDKLIYFPVKEVRQTPSGLGMEWEDVWFEAEDGVKLNGWYLPQDEASPVVLFAHGNAGNLSHRVSFLYEMYRRGIPVFIFDYRGFGKSEGSPDEEGLYRDVEAAWNFLIEEKGYDPSGIVLFGRSLGGSVVAWLAQSVPAGGLVLESTFTSLPELASGIYPFVPSRLVRSQFATEEYLNQLWNRADGEGERFEPEASAGTDGRRAGSGGSVAETGPLPAMPLMIMHSREDQIVPFRFGERLFEAAPEPKTFVELRGGHNENYAVSEESYFDAWNGFLKAVKSRKARMDAGSAGH